MRVLAVVPNYPPRSLVGAWMATHAQLAHLAARGHDVTVIPTHAAPFVAYELDGVTVIPFDRGRTLDDGARHADLVVSHAGDNGAAARAAAAHRVPNVRMVHGHLGDLARRCEGAALVVFNSHTLAAEQRCPAPWTVCHPPVDPTAYRTIPGTHVTLVNLCEAKGGELFWRLARSAPHRQFLGVTGGYGAQYLERRPNVTVIGHTADMVTEVYARTRILLMPSTRETWGMVAVEAMASGIPVVAHPTPGLVESLAGAGIFVDRADGQGWLDTIERLHDPTEWALASALASARSAELDPVESLTRFADHVERLVPACVS